MSVDKRFKDAIKEAAKVLDSTREPAILGTIDHSYQDKFQTVERISSTSINVVRQLFRGIGFTDAHEDQIKDWIAKNQNVSVSFSFTSEARFVKEETREEESDTSVVYKSSVFNSKRTTVTRITEYFWDVTQEYSIRIYAGPNRNDPDKSMLIMEQKGLSEVITKTKSSPGVTYPAPKDISVLIGAFYATQFSIDRSHKKCRTPRRNPEIDSLRENLDEISRWSMGVSQLLLQTAEQFGSVDRSTADNSTSIFSIASVKANDVILPIAPIADKRLEHSDASDTVLLDEDSQEKLFVNFVRKLGETQSEIQEAFNTASVGPDQVKRKTRDQTIFTFTEGSIVFLTHIMKEVSITFRLSVDYIEQQLRTQVEQAIGKHLTPNDMAEYISFHYRKVFRKKFAPKPFCHDVRRPGSTPEGSVSLEYYGKPANTFSLARDMDPATNEPPGIRVALSASTDVLVQGTQVAHGMVMHKFGSGSNPQLNFTGRSRQFSSFVLMLGRIVDSDRFDPEHAMIVQNKDVFEIPINLEVIPTAKEFRKAIASLSPEQQEFASAFRQMQLQATLFAILVLPIRPSMETLLNLPARSLIKEIKLTQDLMKHFIEFQVPSDLLAYDGDDQVPDSRKVDAVRGYAKAVRDMIDESRLKQLQEKEQEAKFKAYDRGVALQEATLFGGMQEDQIVNTRSVKSKPQKKVKAPGGMMRKLSRSIASAAAPPAPVMSMMASAPVADMMESIDDVVDIQDTLSSSQTAVNEDLLELELGGQNNDTTTPERDVQQEQARTEGAGFVEIPKMVEHAFDTLDTDAKLRPTTLHPANLWSRTHREGILGEPETKWFPTNEQKTAKRETLDLLDALSRSGELPLHGATLHVVVATTQCFDETVMDTLVVGNVNPIEPIERSSLILASVIQRQQVRSILNTSEHERVSKHSPMLFQQIEN